MDIINGLVTYFYALIIFVPVCLLTLFCENTRLGRRMSDKVCRMLHIYDEPDILSIRINGEDINVDLDKMSIDQLEALSDWIKKSIAKK